MRSETLLPDYRLVLRSKLQERSARNHRYSLRAFARDLGIDPSRLSLILNGKQGLSEKTARLLASRLGLTQQEIEIFCNSVLASDARSKLGRSLAKNQLLAALSGAGAATPSPASLTIQISPSQIPDVINALRSGFDAWQRVESKRSPKRRNRESVIALDVVLIPKAWDAR